MSVTSAAARVWEYYFSRRSDVEKKPLPENCGARTRMRGADIKGGVTSGVPEYMNMVYTMSPSLIEKLASLDKLEIYNK
jgi:hypothetical protein